MRRKKVAFLPYHYHHHHHTPQSNQIAVGFRFARKEIPGKQKGTASTSLPQQLPKMKVKCRKLTFAGLVCERNVWPAAGMVLGIIICQRKSVKNKTPNLHARGEKRVPASSAAECNNLVQNGPVRLVAGFFFQLFADVFVWRPCRPFFCPASSRCEDLRG